jgi:hypothetical protein
LSNPAIETAVRECGSFMTRCPFSTWLVVMVAAAAAACHAGVRRTSPPRYAVTALPLDVGVRPVMFCLAIDPNEPSGLWWWEPGPSGCTSRSTGPGVFHGDHTEVRSSGTGDVDARFEIQLHGAGARRVEIGIANDTILAKSTGAGVPVERRYTLDIPGLQDTSSWRDSARRGSVSRTPGL